MKRLYSGKEQFKVQKLIFLIAIIVISCNSSDSDQTIEVQATLSVVNNDIFIEEGTSGTITFRVANIDQSHFIVLRKASTGNDSDFTTSPALSQGDIRLEFEPESSEATLDIMAIDDVLHEEIEILTFEITESSIGLSIPENLDIIFRIRNNSISQKLAAYYPFNNNANDESGNGLNGILTQDDKSPNPATDRFGNPNSALSFDGLDDFIRVPHHGALNFIDPDFKNSDGSNAEVFAISLWVKFPPNQVTLNTEYNSIISKGHAGSLGSTTTPFSISIINKSTPATRPHNIHYRRKGRRCGSGGTGTAGSSKWDTKLNDNQFHHIVLNKFPDKVVLYLDNDRVEEREDEICKSRNGDDILIGTSLLDEFFHGVIDEVFLFGRTLSDRDVEYLFNRNQ